MCDTCSDGVRMLAAEDYFRRNENIHIHMSGDFPDNEGVLCCADFFVIHYVISGSAVYEVDGSRYEAKQGDLILIKKEIPFKYTSAKNDERFLFYELMFNSSILSRDKNPSYPYRLLESSFAFYSLLDTRYQSHRFFNFSRSSHSIYGEFLNKAYLEYKKAKNGYNDVLMAYFMLIVINAVRQNESPEGGDGQIYRKQAVEYVQAYINRCYSDVNIQVQGLADLVYLNADYLGRIFKKETGHTITETLQKKRIERVCILLTTTNRPINEIAREAGFNDMHFFYKIFKQRMGVLPGQYRENTKG